MNIGLDSKQNSLGGFMYPTADRNSARSGNTKPRTVNADSFSLTSDDELKKLMEQTGATKVTETVCAKTVYIGAQSAVKAEGYADGTSASYEKYTSCALCYTYLERTLTLEGDKLKDGIMTITSCSESASLSLEAMGKSSVTSLEGEGLTDEMRERIRELMSGETEGDMKSLSDRWGKCTDLLSSVFGADMSEFALDETGYAGLFGKLDADEDSYITKSLERLEMIREYMSRLRERMAELLKGVRENDPYGMDVFGSVYFRLETYSYTEITALTDRAAEEGSVTVPEKAQVKEGYASSLKYESYTYSETTVSAQRTVTASGSGESVSDKGSEG